jgi:symplekin
MFPSFTETVQNVIRSHIGGLIKALSSQPAKLLQLISEFPPQTDVLILRIIHILSEKTPVPVEIVDTVKKVYHERKLSAQFLIPVLPSMPKVFFNYLFTI